MSYNPIIFRQKVRGHPAFAIKSLARCLRAFNVSLMLKSTPLQDTAHIYYRFLYMSDPKMQILCTRWGQNDLLFKLVSRPCLIVFGVVWSMCSKCMIWVGLAYIDPLQHLSVCLTWARIILGMNHWSAVWEGQANTGKNTYKTYHCWKNANVKGLRIFFTDSLNLFPNIHPHQMTNGWPPSRRDLWVRVDRKLFVLKRLACKYCPFSFKRRPFCTNIPHEDLRSSTSF